ncbi:Transmembrane protein [Halotydeus destructor]|nr:Transmembrane protein [Halotydeus destructor]
MSTSVVLLEYFLLIVDIFANCFANFVAKTLIQRLSIYFVQDLCLILALIVLFLVFFRSKILKQGLLGKLLKQNSICFLIAAIYLSLTIALQIVSTIHYHGQSTGDLWHRNETFVALLIVQRIMSAIYYYTYRTTTFKLHNIGSNVEKKEISDEEAQ